MADDNVDVNPEENDTSPEQMAEQALESAEQIAQKLQAETEPQNFDLPDIDGAETTNGSATGTAAGLALLNDVSLNVKIELGRTKMYIEDVLRLNAESVIELDKAAGDPVDIFVNERLIARGEVLVLNENFCVRVSEIIDQVEKAPGE